MPPYRVVALVSLAVLAAACGGAVTDPLDESFDGDPSPILGVWHLVGEDGCADPGHVLVVEKGAGTLYGHFAFPLWSQEWQVFFADAPWDAGRFEFRHPETYGLNMPNMRWEGVHWPERSYGNPADPIVVPEAVSLSGIRSFTYQRPGVHRAHCPTG
jgi:hypothetical protein